MMASESRLSNKINFLFSELTESGSLGWVPYWWMRGYQMGEFPAGYVRFVLGLLCSSI